MTVQTAPTVLVVDDEEDLREAMCRMLQRRGFATLAAADPAEAVAICRDPGRSVDLLLTDLGMPGTSGCMLARLAIEVRPELRVLYVSGLSREMALDQGLLADEATLVQKPYTAEGLSLAVRRALAAPDRH